MVVRNGDPNGYPGCVNLSFSYVEGESLLMALKVIPYSSSGETRKADRFAPPGCRSLVWFSMHVGIAGTFLRASSTR